MKKLLLVSTAIAGVAFVSAPASAALKMDLGGYFEGYGLYADNHDSTRDFTFRRDNELFVNGESTLDNGLTIGAHTQLNIGNTDNTGAITATSTFTGAPLAAVPATPAGTVATTIHNTTGTDQTQLVDETYLYGSGQWGRVNFGEEDGAAYLLQVAAPSADSNVDGMRVYIQGLDTQNWNASLAGLVLSYQQADFRQADRLTYLTPKFNGFQAGVSYAPDTQSAFINADNTTAATSAGTSAMLVNNIANSFKNPWEAAARWDGRFSGVDLSLGAGYSDASAENTAASGVGFAGSKNLQTYNFGGNVGLSGFSLGAGYKHTNNGIEAAGGDNTDTKTWDVGGAYDNGPYHVGLSYFHDTLGDGLLSTAESGDSSVHRYAAGAGYTFGPGMTFRGSVDWGKFDANSDETAHGTASERFTQVTVGTDVQF
jgi:outer membrane protein OmpU